MMAPVDDPLQGLNTVPQPPPPSSLSDSQDLLSVPPYSDLAAQLDLWTHISFASDEPFVSSHNDADNDDNISDKKQTFDRESGGASEEMKRKRQMMGSRRLPIDQSQTAATFTQPNLQPQPASGSQLPMPQPFDLQNLFALAAMSSTPMTPDLQNMNLHNLLALGAYNPFLSQPAATSLPTMLAQQPTSTPISTATTATSPPPAKKSRVRKASTSMPAPLFIPSPEASSDLKSPDPPSPMDDKTDSGSLNPSEDKRRRNTQASARFRLKKKEREAAMETRCKELEAKVGELERECEALRRENGWLKGLVVGVTGGGQMPIMPGSGMSLAGLSSTVGSAASLTKGRETERQ